ncbi:hypothetical protein QJS04_geneDACA011732 [Acorus gramineus]|uniref:Uncharacterized protein n=1 Tax=Acorus gramineus TaxID=55184 RepID=A0AAV9BH34_ACOGR|nr:hypothetical protein QJS04_geneDACA011732 [Acorus gramineus]
MLQINVSQAKVLQLAGLAGCAVQSFPTRLLGLPLVCGRMKKMDWDPLVELFQRRLVGWKGRFLSYRGWGGLILLQAVLTSLPLFFLSVFRILAGVFDRIDRSG